MKFLFVRHEQVGGVERSMVNVDLIKRIVPRSVTDIAPREVAEMTMIDGTVLVTTYGFDEICARLRMAKLVVTQGE